MLLNAGQPQIDENGGGAGTTQSIQRQPDGAGGARNTSAYVTATPTPDASNGGTPPPPVLSRIHEIQGAQHRSPLEGQVVATGGIVSSIFELSASNKGFYIQDPDGDGDPATSEGILVFVGSAALPAIAVGDEVTVQGTVTEFRPGGSGGANNLSTTELTGTTTTVESTSVFTNPLSATVIGAAGRVPPTAIVDDDTSGGDVEVAANTTFDPASDGVDFYESLEGMRVRIENGLVTGPTSGFGEVFLVPDGGVGATGLNARGGITLNLPGGGTVDYNPERIQIDDDYFRVALGDMPQAKVGDTVAAVEGVVTYNFGNFEVLPSAQPSFTDGGLLRETAGVSTGPDRLTIANYNVENLDINDDDICNGSALDDDVAEGRFEAIAQQVVSSLGSPDILALQEVQDDSGCADDGTVVGTQTLARVVNSIALAGGPSYTAVEITPVNNAEGGQPSGNIRVAYLYNGSRVSLVPGTLGVGGSQDATNAVLHDGKLALTLSPGRIDPLNAAWTATRVSLAAVFEFNGQRVLTINNHWSSKGGSSPILGRVQPFLNGSEAARNAQAAVVNNFVDSVLGLDADAKLAVLGDLNEFTFNAPLLTLTGQSDGNLILTDLGDALIADEVERYSYVFEGNTQALDHILVTDALLAPEVATEFDAVHVNSEFPDQLSDHDPDIVSFLLPVPPPCEGGTLQLRRVVQSVVEGEGASAQINVARIGRTCGAVSVSYSLASGSATAGLDFMSTSGTLTWADGDARDQVFNVQILDDDTDEPQETLQVNLDDATGAALGTPSQATVRINDDDATPQLTLGPDQSVPEGTVDVTTEFFLDRPSSRDVLVKLSIGGTAELRSDYRFNTGRRVRFPAGQTSVSKVLHTSFPDIVDDRRAEPDETIVFTVTSVRGAVLSGPDSTTITVLDDD